MSTPMKSDDVRERLSFAEKRLSELLTLNGGNLGGANSAERQQLLQEFFFHLVGAREMLAQLINEMRSLGMNSEQVSVSRVAQNLLNTDPIKSKLAFLHLQISQQPLPADPYSDEGYIFRILNYRHQVTHRRRNPLFFRVGDGPAESLLLDPRSSGNNRDPSKKSIQEDLSYMMVLVRTKCEEILNLL